MEKLLRLFTYPRRNWPVTNKLSSRMVRDSRFYGPLFSMPAVHGILDGNSGR